MTNTELIQSDIKDSVISPFPDCSHASEGKSSVRLRSTPDCSLANKEDGALQEGDRSK